jgi:hypothetical protein
VPVVAPKVLLALKNCTVYVPGEAVVGAVLTANDVVLLVF